MNLNNHNWKVFAFTDIFTIKDGYYNKKPPVETNGNIPFLGATQYDNGITGFYTLPTIQKYDKVGTTVMNDHEKRMFKGNCIAITNNGSVGNAYYQVVDFTCSHDITPIYLKNYTLNRYIALFLIPMIMKSGESFEYAKKWRPKRMRKSQILLPATADGTPDWLFMEQYMKQTEQQILKPTLEQLCKQLITNELMGGGIKQYTQIGRNLYLVKSSPLNQQAAA
ncbi:MAG: restriction endonuclease subunit S [Paludibacteraceae bacterium]